MHRYVHTTRPRTSTSWLHVIVLGTLIAASQYVVSAKALFLGAWVEFLPCHILVLSQCSTGGNTSRCTIVYYIMSSGLMDCQAYRPVVWIGCHRIANFEFYEKHFVSFPSCAKSTALPSVCSVSHCPAFLSDFVSDKVLWRRRRTVIGGVYVSVHTPPPLCPLYSKYNKNDPALMCADTL